MARCPGCGERIELGKEVKQGYRIVCPECGELLEVISLKPLELDYALEEEESGEEGDEEEY